MPTTGASCAPRHVYPSRHRSGATPRSNMPTMSSASPAMSSSRCHNLQNARCDHAGSRCGLELNECLPDVLRSTRGHISQIDQATASHLDEGREPGPAQVIGLHYIDDGVGRANLKAQFLQPTRSEARR